MFEDFKRTKEGWILQSELDKMTDEELLTFAKLCDEEQTKYSYIGGSFSSEIWRRNRSKAMNSGALLGLEMTARPTKDGLTLFCSKIPKSIKGTFQWEHDSFDWEKVHIRADDGELWISGPIKNVLLFANKQGIKIVWQGIEEEIEQCEKTAKELRRILEKSDS